MAGGGNKVTGTQTTTPNVASKVAPFNPTQKTALQGMQDYAGRSIPALAENFMRLGNAQYVAGADGLTDLQDQQVNRLQGVAGGNGLNAEQQSALDRLNPIASGSMMQGNPFLDDIINRNAEDIRYQTGLAASGMGRYGSGGHEGVLQKSLGDMTSNLRYQNYTDEANRRDQALRDVFNMGSTGFGQRNDAIGSLYNAGQQGFENLQGGAMALQSAYDALLSPYRTLLGVGQQRQDQVQKGLDAAHLSGGTTTQSSVPNNPIQNGIGGFLSGFGATGNPWMGALGAAGSLF